MFTPSEISILVEQANNLSYAMDKLADEDEALFEGIAYKLLDNGFHTIVNFLNKEKGSDWLVDNVHYPIG